MIHTANGLKAPPPLPVPSPTFVLVNLTDLARLADEVARLRDCIDRLSTPAPPAEAQAPAAVPADLTPTDRAILRVVEAEPHKAEWIARRIGRPCNSHFRSRLSFLCRVNLLARTLDGYRKPPTTPQEEPRP